MNALRAILVFVLATGVAYAQGQGAPAAPGAAAQPEAPAAQPPAGEDSAASPEPGGFTYNPEGRRDPFMSLLRRGTDAQRGAIGARPPGLAGLGVGEVTLRGTVQSRDGFVAILQGADAKTYIVRPGDRLLDGTVRTITQNDMVILQQVNDPLSLEKQREVRKTLRQTEAN
jgi:Tfp pilus assembly protein PilP